MMFSVARATRVCASSQPMASQASWPRWKYSRDGRPFGCRGKPASIQRLNPRRALGCLTRQGPATVVGVVGGADEGKGAVVAVLVAVDLLPVAHRVSLERVADGGNGLEQLQDGLGLGQPGHQAGLPGQG